MNILFMIIGVLGFVIFMLIKLYFEIERLMSFIGCLRFVKSKLVKLFLIIMLFKVGVFLFVLMFLKVFIIFMCFNDELVFFLEEFKGEK